MRGERPLRWWPACFGRVLVCSWFCSLWIGLTVGIASPSRTTAHQGHRARSRHARPRSGLPCSMTARWYRSAKKAVPDVRPGIGHQGHVNGLRPKQACRRGPAPRPPSCCQAGRCFGVTVTFRHAAVLSAESRPRAADSLPAALHWESCCAQSRTARPPRPSRPAWPCDRHSPWQRQRWPRCSARCRPFPR